MKWVKIIVVALCCFASVASAKRRKSRGYSKAVEGQAVVLNKLFPKAGRAEIVSNFGGIINQSYINTILIQGGFNYYFSEVWGMAIEGVYAINSDKNERLCLEGFYNLPKETEVKGVCYQDGPNDHKPSKEKPSLSNMGPAYVPITELQYLFSLSTIWTPVYGKQIFSALPVTGHMDIFFTIGGGLATTNHFAQKTKVKGEGGGKEKKLRCQGDDGAEVAKLPPISTCGVFFDDKEKWGKGGRPEPQKKPALAINLGIGQKYYFASRLYLDIELRTYNLIGGAETFHNFFTLWGGLGFRF